MFYVALLDCVTSSVFVFVYVFVLAGKTIVRKNLFVIFVDRKTKRFGFSFNEADGLLKNSGSRTVASASARSTTAAAYTWHPPCREKRLPFSKPWLANYARAPSGAYLGLRAQPTPTILTTAHKNHENSTRIAWKMATHCIQHHRPSIRCTADTFNSANQTLLHS